MKLISAIPALILILALAVQPAIPATQPITLVAVNVQVANNDQARATRSIPAGQALPRIWGCYATYNLRGDMTEIWARIGEAEYVKVQDDNGKYIEHACEEIILTDPMPVASGSGTT